MKVDAISRAMEGAEQAPLSAEQKKRLAIAARHAWEMQSFCGLSPADETFDAWRRRHALMAVERPGLRASTNGDYAFLMAHFLDMQAQAAEREPVFGGADEAARLRRRAEALRLRAQVEPLSWAHARLRKELAAAGDVIARPSAYAASIAHSKFRTGSFADLTERQVWVLVFDLRRAASARRKRGGAR